MKKILFAAIFASTQAFAIVGVGVHYVTNTGTLKGETEKNVATAPLGLGHIDLKRHDASVLQGLGFKLWVDVLPFIDVEGTFNMAATKYKTSLEIVPPIGDKTEIPLEYKPGTPYNMVFGEAVNPLYGLFSGDLSITYPFDILPIIRPYAGVGVSYMASIPIINKAFVKDMEPALEAALENKDDPKNASIIGKELSEALKKSDFNTGFGGHLIAGVRAKVPLIPIAAYVNTKYYFGDPDKKFKQGATFELGGGFAL